MYLHWPFTWIIWGQAECPHTPFLTIHSSYPSTCQSEYHSQLWIYEGKNSHYAPSPAIHSPLENLDTQRNCLSMHSNLPFLFYIFLTPLLNSRKFSAMPCGIQRPLAAKRWISQPLLWKFLLFYCTEILPGFSPRTLFPLQSSRGLEGIVISGLGGLAVLLPLFSF